MLFCSWSPQNYYVHRLQNTIIYTGSINNWGGRMPTTTKFLSSSKKRERERERELPLDGAEGKPVGHLISD